MTLKIRLETLTCPSCVAKIEKGVTSLKGVENVDVRFNASLVNVVYDDSVCTAEEITKIIEDLGFVVK